MERSKKKKQPLTDEEKALQEIRALIKESQDSRDRRQKKQSAKVVTPFGLFTKSANSKLNQKVDTRTPAEIHESRRRLYHSNSDVKGETINLRAIDHTLRKYANEMGPTDYHLLSTEERGKKTSLEQFTLSMSKVDAFAATRGLQLSKSVQKLPLPKGFSEGVKTKPPDPPSSSAAAVAASAPSTAGKKKISFHITASRLKKKYPQYCSFIHFSDEDVKTLSCRHDNFMTKFMETCYDESILAFSSSVAHGGRKKLHHGLDAGSLDSFPSLVQRIVAQQFSTLELRLKNSLEILYTLEYLIQTAEFSRYKMEYDELKLVFDGGRPLLFSRFLSEEYDVDVLATFLHCREFIQSELGHKLKDINPTRINLDEKLLEKQEQSKVFANLLEQSQKPMMPSGKQSKLLSRLPPRKLLEPMPSATKLSSSLLSKEYRLAEEFLDTHENSSKAAAVEASKVVPLVLPPKWCYLDDVALPETPLVGFEKDNLMHFCFQIAPESIVEARQYLCKQVRDVAVSDMLREGSVERKLTLLQHIHVYAFLRAVCYEWKKITAEDKTSFTETGKLLDNLNALNEIYDDNCRRIKDAADAVLQAEGRLSVATANVMKLEKQSKRLQKKFDARVTTRDDLNAIPKLQEELALARIERENAGEALMMIKKDKDQLQVQVDKLWSNIMDRAPNAIARKHAGSSNGSATVFWRHFITFMLGKTLQHNAHEAHLVQQAAAASKTVVANALLSTTGVSTRTSTLSKQQPVAAKAVSTEEVRFTMVEVLARIVARNALLDGTRKVLLRDFMRQRRFDLLLKYGDPEAQRAEAERLQKLRAERIAQERQRMTVLLARAMAPSIVQDIFTVATKRAGMALYDPWWMLDIDPVKFVPMTTLELVERSFHNARLRHRHRMLAYLYRVLARCVYESRLRARARLWLLHRRMRQWYQLQQLNLRAKHVTISLQRAARAFLWRRRHRRYMMHQRELIMRADHQYTEQWRHHVKFPRMVSYWREYATLKRRYREVRAALKERRFLLCFYTWLDRFKRLRIAHWQQSLKHRAAAIVLQCSVRCFLARRRVRKQRARRTLLDFVRVARARSVTRLARQQRRRQAECARYVTYRVQCTQLQGCLQTWMQAWHYMRGGDLLALAHRHILMRKRLNKWIRFTQWRTQYLGRFATRMQSLFRMFLVFRRHLRYYTWRRALIRNQGLIRRYLARRQFAYDIYYYRHARTIQRCVRGWLSRSHLDQRRVYDIHYAAANNRYERLKFYVDHRPDLVYRLDAEGNSALHHAAQNAAKRTLKLLMRFGLPPNVLNTAGFSPLHLCISSAAVNRDECFVYMLERGFDDDQLTGTGQTCLLLAAEAANVVILKRLLADGHDTNVPDMYGRTCLQAACSTGNAAAVEALLENEAEVDKVGYNGTYPIHEAVSGGNVAVLHALLRYQVSINVVEPNYQQTPLMWAAQLGLGDMARQLILYGAEVNARDYQGKTAAHYAAMTNTVDIYHALREAEADFDVRDDIGDTPLHLAAKYNAFRFAQEVLHGGAYPSFQNDVGDQPAHIAAQFNQVALLQVIAQYDEHIGRCNYAHLTPLGVAKFHGSREAQEFLTQHYFIVETVDGRNAAGHIWWDKAIDQQTQDWQLQLHADGTRSFVHVRTGEISETPPAVSLSTVQALAQQAELPLQRAIVMVTEGSALTKHEYYLEYAEQKADIAIMNKEYRHANVILKWARRKLAYMALRKLREQTKRNRVILRFLKRHLPGFMLYRHAMKTRLATKIQALWRGAHLRTIFYAPETGDYWPLRQRLAHRRLRYNFWSLWQAYKRKMAFRNLLVIAKMPRTIADWQLIVEKQRRPLRVVGVYEEYAYPQTRNVTFYRHAVTGDCTFLKPIKLIMHDEAKLIELQQIKEFGATLPQIALTIRLQALWRGYTVRHYSRSIEKALDLCQSAEAKYLAHPEVDTNVYNYALYCLTFSQDIERARKVFLEALRRMQWRGPDVAFVLYAYAIFGLLTDDEEYADVVRLVERARLAEEHRAVLLRNKYQKFGADAKTGTRDEATMQREFTFDHAFVPPPKPEVSQKTQRPNSSKQEGKDEPGGDPGGMSSRPVTGTITAQKNTSTKKKKKSTTGAPAVKAIYPYGRVFDLAAVGFFQYTAGTLDNAMACESLALCRFLVYNDFRGSFDAFLRAFRHEPKNERIRKHFTRMMTHFHGPDPTLHDALTKERLQRLAQIDADLEEMRRQNRVRAQQRWEAASRIKRWYKERRAARTFHRFLEMIRDMVRRRTQAAYLQRGRR